MYSSAALSYLHWSAHLTLFLTLLVPTLCSLHFVGSPKCFLVSQSNKGFPGGSDGKESACNVEDPGSIPDLGRCPGEGKDYPLQYSCLENPMDRGAWGLQSLWSQRVGHNWAINTRVTKPTSKLLLPSSYQHVTVIGDFISGWRGIDLLSKWPPNHSFVLRFLFGKQLLGTCCLLVLVLEVEWQASNCPGELHSERGGGLKGQGGTEACGNTGKAAFNTENTSEETSHWQGFWEELAPARQKREEKWGFEIKYSWQLFLGKE